MADLLTTAQLREMYLNFFEKKGCTRYTSASLVTDDPTTLFTVAGMAQFKDMFLGRGTLPFTRATTCQKCMRTNDILQVGRTARHHTFFEMLGNFSFNDYFKRDTIAWAWEFLTEVIKLDKERLSVSVHHIDDEAFDIWAKEIGLPEDRIFRMGDSDNFWPADAPSDGPLGPGGCCSEIFWDYRTNDDPADNLTKDAGRFVEVWNLVFPQFNVVEPMVDGRYTLNDLGRTNIDTGMGLERLACVVQGKNNNFDIDLLQTIVQKVVGIVDKKYVEGAPAGSPEAEQNALIRRVADHVRGVSFAIADGAQPSNTGAGYIVRRLIRRAVLDADKLGMEDPCLYAVVPAVVEAMGEAYPEIAKRGDMATQLIEQEEKQFRKTLRRGLDLLQRELDAHQVDDVFDGDKAFRLYETYGFPREITEEILDDKGLKIDDVAWDAAEDAHKNISRSKGIEVFTASALQDAKPRLGTTLFIGYDQLEANVELVLLEQEGAEVAAAQTGGTVRFALSQTPFYAESGGQVADQGMVCGDGFVIQVTDVQKDEGLVIHTGTVVSGTAKPGPVKATVDPEARGKTVAHHSATHLLHSALCSVLGDHVEQQGSKVDPKELRFDFNHPHQPSREEMAKIETMVNDHIILGHAVKIEEMAIDAARERGAKALFGEKYGDIVRVVEMGSRDVSIELCGGCHVQNTDEIKHFRIVREEASAAGVRRITAVAGSVAKDLADEEERLALRCGESLGLGDVESRELQDVAQLLKAQPQELPDRIKALMDEAYSLEGEVSNPAVTQLLLSGGLLARVKGLQTQIKRLRKEAQHEQAKRALARVDDIIAGSEEVAGIPVMVAELDGADSNGLREVGNAIKAKVPSYCLMLGSNCNGKAMLLSLVSKDLNDKGLRAGDLVGQLAKLVGGGGGGRPDQAQAGGKLGEKVTEALASAKDMVRNTVMGG